MNQFTSSNPKSSGDLKTNNDCMIRAVANITGNVYRDVHAIMYQLGWRAVRRNSKGNWQYQILKTLDELGFKATYESFPAIKGESRICGYTFNKSGKWILRMAKHISAYIDGVLVDSWDCRYKCVYFAWKIEPKN